MLFYIFLAMQSLISIALHATRPIISLFADSQGASVFVIGLLVSTYAFFPLLMAIKVGKWLDLYGARILTLFGAVGLLVALIIPTNYPRIATLFISQALLGLGQICTLLALQKTVGNLPGNRDKLIAAFSLTASIGEFIGPLYSGFSYQHFGFQITFGVSATLILICLAIGLLIKPTSWKSGESSKTSDINVKTSTWEVLSDANLRKVLSVSALVLYSKDLFVAYFPVYGSALGMTAGNIGVALSIMAGMSILVRSIQFWLVDKFSRGTVLTATLIMSGIAYLLVGFTSYSITLVLLAGLLGAGLGLGQPLSLVYVFHLIPVERHGEILGVRITFNRGTQFVAPFIFGGVGKFAGISPIFWISGIILLLGAYFTRIPHTDKELSGKLIKFINK